MKNNLVILIIVLVTIVAFITTLCITSCGVGKKGDKDPPGYTEPPSTVYWLIGWKAVGSIEMHAPFTWKFDRRKDGVLLTAEIKGNSVETKDAESFMRTYTGPGHLIGGTYQNGAPYKAAWLAFTLDLPPLSIASYHLSVEGKGDLLTGRETLVIDGKITQLAVTYRKKK